MNSSDTLDQDLLKVVSDVRNDYAQIRIRAFGAFIDYTFFYLFLFIFTLIAGQPGANGVEGKALGLLPMTVAWLLYFPIVEGMTGQTLGKKILRIRVLRAGGREINIGHALARRLFDWVDLSLLGIIGIVIAKNTDKKQRLGDLIARTIVIQDGVQKI